jgi:hypothetical protein
MTNADLSFDDLIRLGGPAPVGRETETGRVRRRRHARPDAAAEPRPVRTLHAVEGVSVAQEPAIENAAADDDTPLEDLLSMVGLDAAELQIVETTADAPGTVLAAAPVAAAPAAAAVSAPVSVMPMPESAVQTPVSAAPAPPVVAEPMPTAVESPRRAAAAAAAAAVAAPVSAVTTTSIVAEPAPASEAPVSPRRAAAAASAVPAPVAAMPAPVAAMPAPVAAVPSASVVAEPVPAAALIESPRRAAAAAEAAPAKQLTAPKQPKADRADKRGEFYRAELSSNWQRFRENIAVRVSGWVVLVGATGGLVFAAVSRF